MSSSKCLVGAFGVSKEFFKKWKRAIGKSPESRKPADKSTIVEEAIKYIKSLQQNLEKLQKQTMEQPSVILQPSGLRSREAFMADHSKNLSKTNTPKMVPPVPRFDSSCQTWSSPNVVLNVTGKDAHISICATKKLHIFSTLLFVLEKHNLHVVFANISSGHFKIMYMIHSRDLVDTAINLIQM